MTAMLPDNSTLKMGCWRNDLPPTACCAESNLNWESMDTLSLVAGEAKGPALSGSPIPNRVFWSHLEVKACMHLPEELDYDAFPKIYVLP